MPSRPGLPSKLTMARQQRQKARSRDAALEAQLGEGTSNVADLTSSEDRYHHILDTLLEGCQLIGFDWRYRYVNDTAARHNQRPKHELLGYTMMERYPGIEQTALFAVLQRCMEARQIERVENEVTYPDGTSAWFELRVQPVPEGISILSLDITAHKQAEENIRKLHRTLGVLSDINQTIVRVRHLPSLFEKACAIAVDKGTFRIAWIGLFDPKTGRIDPATSAGIAANDLEKLISTLNTPTLVTALRGGARLICNDMQTDPRWDSWREEALRLGCRATVALPLLVAGELRGIFNLYADATDFFDAQEMRLMDEMAGDIAFAIEVAEQDEQRLKAEADLRTSEEKYRSLIESSESVISVFNAEGTFLFANQVAATGLGLTPETLIGRNLADLFPPPSAQGQLARIREVIQSRQGTIYEAIRIVLGEERWYRSSIQPIRDSAGQVTSAVVNTVDITRLKQAEAVLRNEKETLEQKVVERTADLQTALGRIKAILNNSPDAILLVDAALTIQQTNQSFNTLFSAGSDGDLGQSLLALFHPDDVHLISHLPQVAATPQNGNHLEVCAVRKNGTTFDAELTIGAIKGDGLVCIIRDITERKAQERQLRYHASIQESVSDAVIATDMAFRIQSWNHTAELIYGWRAEETIGRSVSEILQTTYASAEDGERILRDFFERGAWQGEVIQHHRDGRLIHVHAAVNLFKDETGQPIGVVSVNRDITERKRAAEALQKSAAEIHDLYNNAPCGYHSLDQDGLIVQINDTELRWLGYTRDEVVGKLKITEICTLESLSIYQKLRPALIQQGWFNNVEVELVRKDGSIIHILLNATAIYDDDGQFLRSRATLFDITARKRAEESLHESEERFRRAILDAPFPIMIHADNGEVLHISNVWAEISGYTHAEIPTMAAWIEKAYRESSQTVRPLIEKVYTLTKPRRGGEFRIWTKAGEERIWDFISAPLAAMPDGRCMVSSMAMDVTDRKQAEDALQTKVAEERQFQLYLKALHEIIIELTGIDQLDTFYQRAVELGRERLGFERLAMFLYDAQDDSAIGTYGTDTQGKLVDERGVRFTPDPNGVMQRSFERIERFYVKEETTLYNDTIPVGSGWNAAATLWNGSRSLGWFVTDNLLSHAPASKPLLDTLGLYALSVGTLLAQKQTQVALKESEALYRLLAENITDLIVRSTLTSECRYVSPSVQTLMGYRPEELIGQQTSRLVHPDDQAIIGEAFASDLERQELILPHQYRIKHKNGHYIWIETVGKPIFKAGANEPLEIITSSRDITARRLAEAALRESEARYRLLAENLADIIMTFSLDRQITYMSPSCEKLLGYLPEEVEGKSHSEFIHPEDYPHVLDRTRRAVIAKEDSYTNQFRLRHKAGHYIWYEVRTRVVWELKTGKVAQFVSVLRDITERKAAEDALRESEEKFRSLVETMRGGLAVFDPEFRVTYVNDRFCELLGYAREEVIGKQPLSFVDATDTPLVQAHLGHRQRGESTSYEIPIRHKAGHQLYLLMSGSPLLDQQGKYNGSIVVATDITIQKQAEATLRQALAKEKELGDLKTRFVSMASHEFRTPLATILAVVETLSIYRRKLSEEQIDQRFDKIKDQVGHLKDIMEDVLLLARMQARRVEFHPVQVDLDALARSVLDEFQSQTESAHRLEYTVSDGGYEVWLDRKLMRQLISNLVSNAIKYSPAETVVRLQLDYSDAAVILTIRDEGIGIPEADLPHLFEPFHRAANVGTISGTGLGLVIAREAVELHGGAITVESQPGVGTTFLVRIPTSAGEAQQRDAAPGQ